MINKPTAFSMKQMMTVLFSLLFFEVSLSAQVAQERWVIATSGGQSSSGSLSLSWTLGEPMTETYNASGLTVSQGFQQGALNTTGTHDASLFYEVTVFPNPTSQTLYVTAPDADSPLLAELVGLNGTVLWSQQLAHPIEKSPIPVAMLPEATYFLVLRNDDGMSTTFKIQKF
jgi:hypothetical protein